MQTTKQNTTRPDINNDEHILVVPRAKIFTNTYWNGLHTENIDLYTKHIHKNAMFRPRSIMEHDQTYKQIIPYLVFSYKNRVFLMQRTASASEQRLRNKYSLGIGGHMRAHDMQQGTTIFDWAQREFHEEISYDGDISVTPLGILNDDSDAVGKVHLGLVLLLKGTSQHITIKSELKQGMLVNIAELSSYQDHLENWSRLIFPTIQYYL